MSNEKSSPKQYHQESDAQPQADMLDAQYKPIGIGAVAGAMTAAKCTKVKTPSEQWN